jgi:ABC-2 type transport system ATP-binding protein
MSDARERDGLYSRALRNLALELRGHPHTGSDARERDGLYSRALRNLALELRGHPHTGSDVATRPAPGRPGNPDDPGPLSIESWGLTKRFGRTQALAGIDLRVPRNVVFGYLGPNGAGKTTTIRILTGLMRPTSGRVEVLGRDVVARREAAQRMIGYLPGDFVAYPDLTGEQYLHHLANLRGGVDWSVVEDIVNRLDVELNRRIGTLSRGNRQKIGIVQAFMHQPELLVLDEPTVGLDPLVQREFLQLVHEARTAGRTVFLSSHVLSEVEAVADLVGIVREGRLVVTDAVSRLQRQAVRRIDLVFAGSPPVDTLRQASGVRQVDVHERTAHLSVEGSTADLLRVAAPLGIENVVTHETDLAEIFLGWYQDEEAR